MTRTVVLSEEELAAQQIAAVTLYHDAEMLLGQPYEYDQQVVLLTAEYRESMTLAEAAVVRMLSVGKRLFIIKDLETHGKFEAACNAAGIESQRASEVMRLYREIGDSPVAPALFSAGPSKLLELVRMPEGADKDEVLATGVLRGEEVDRMPIRRLREMLRSMRDEKLKLEASLAEKQKQNDIGTRQVEELEEKLRSAQDKGRRKTAKFDVELRAQIDKINDAYMDLVREFTSIDFSDADLITADIADVMLKGWCDHAMLMRCDLERMAEVASKKNEGFTVGPQEEEAYIQQAKHHTLQYQELQQKAAKS